MQTLNPVWQDTPAWLEETYDLYGAASYSLAVRILGVGEAAEDAVTEAFREVVRLHHVDEHADVRAVILLITRNTAVTRLRQLKGLAVHGIAPVHLGRTLGVAATHPSQDDVRIRDAVEELESTLRLVLIRTFFEGHTPAEVAVELGVTTTEVNDALAAAMSALSARSAMPRCDSSCREPEINCATLARHP